MKDELKEIIVNVKLSWDTAMRDLAGNPPMPSSDMILQCAQAIYCTHYIQNHRQESSFRKDEAKSSDKSTSFAPATPAPVTEKQAFFLSKHGLNPANFNKQTAFTKIDEIKKKELKK